MTRFLINPFRRIAGWEALGLGVLISALTAIVGYLSNTHFPDLISVKLCPGIPLTILFCQSILNWVVVSLLLYLSAIILSTSKVRFIDIIGTQGVARFPYLLAAVTGFSGSLSKFGNYIVYTTLQKGTPVEITTFEIGIAVILIVLTMIFTVWMVTLMVNGFKVSANLKGPKLVIPFIIIVIVSTVITGIISAHLLQSIQHINLK